MISPDNTISVFRRLSKSILFYGMGSAASKLLAFIMLPLLTAYLAPVDYGVSAMLNWCTFLLQPVFSLGIGGGMALVYFQRPDREWRDTVLGSAVLLLAISVASLILIMLLSGTYASLWVLSDSRHKQLLDIAVIGLACAIVATPFQLYYQFEEKARTFAVQAIFASVVTGVLTVFLLVLLKQGLRGVVLADMTGKAILLAIVCVGPLVAGRLRFSRGVIRLILRNSVPLIPSFLCLFVMQQTGYFVLKECSNLEAVGIFTLGTNIGMAINLLVSAFQTAWVPFFMSYLTKQEEAESLFGNITWYYFLTMGSITILGFGASRLFILLFTSAAFERAYLVIGCSALSQVLLGVFTLLLPGMYYRQDVKYVTVLQAAAALVGVLINLLLVPLFGLTGAAVSLVLTSATLVLLTYQWNLHRKNYVQIRYPWRRIATFSAVFLALCVPAMMPRRWSILSEIGVALFYVLAAAGTAYSCLSCSDRKWLRERIACRAVPLGGNA